MRSILVFGVLTAAAAVVVDAQSPVRGPWTCDEEAGTKSRTVRTWRNGRMTETTETAPCDPVPCVVFTKETDSGPWGSCNRELDGRWYRYKVLGIQTPAKFGGSCPPAWMRRARERCMPVACVVKTAEEETTNTFGACTLDTDGSYYKSKLLGIKTAALYGGTCPSEAERQHRELCPPENCEWNEPEDETSAFGECTLMPDGTYYKFKTLAVTKTEQYGGTCPAATDDARQYGERCPPVDCVYNTEEQETSEFGECQQEADGYYQYRTLQVTAEAVYDGTCPTEAQRQQRKLCPPENCEWNDPEDETAEFGECESTASGYYQYRTLAITKTEQYGGTCPGPEDTERRESRYCEPVACVVKTAEEETTNEFGACQQEGTAYAKYKTLGIKTEALYGGTCPTEAQRQHRELCAPVACVVKTTTEDTGPFGRCQQESDGWYKYRTLGIKTAALYGGSCPSETDPVRRVRAQCTRTCRPLAPGFGIGAAAYFDTTLRAASGAACCELCRARPRCESYVFYTSTRQCWIMSAMRTQFRSVTAFGGTVVSA